MPKTQKSNKAAALANRRAKARMEKEFVAVSFSRKDLEARGYDTSKVDDDTMESFVSEVGGAFDDVDLDDYVEMAVGSCGIPKRTQESAE